MTREELIDHLEHLAEYVKYSEDAPALREVIERLKCSEMPNSSDERTETHACDLIKRQDAIDAVNSIDNLDAKARGGICFKLMGLPPAQPDHHIAEVSKKVECPTFKDSSQYAQPDNRLSKIAELAEGTIDHFDLDDAMDLLYQIKEIVGNEASNIRG